MKMSFMAKLFGRGSADEPTDYYSVVFKATGVSVTLEVNGEQVMQDDYPFGGAGSRPVNAWTKKGANSLTVKLKPVEGGTEDFVKYELLFTKDQKGMMAGDGEKLWEFLWEKDASPETLPLEKTFDFEIS
jgi:hypothetical protein